MLVPIIVGMYYSEPLNVILGYIVGSAASLILGLLLQLAGGAGSPSTNEAMFATVLGWIMAIGLGAVPLTLSMSVLDAFFESTAGLTTTGISMLEAPGELEKSVLFWRSFMQWIGGLGVLTFFIAVIRESGGVSRRLFSAEAHKADPGSIRPSLSKSIFALWKVYGFLTMSIMAIYMALGMSPFNAIIHSFSGLSTGGFSTMANSIGGLNSPNIELFTTLVMLLGGINFVLLYKFLRNDFKSMFKNSEFKLYMKIFGLISLFIFIELVLRGESSNSAILDSVFQSAAVISSTGYSTLGIASLSVFLQSVFIIVMFVGGSVGSTSGGVKVFRVKAMIELAKTRVRSYSLPKTAVNEVKIDGEILESKTMQTISTIFFIWVSTTVILTLLGVLLEDISFMTSMSAAVSTIGNMGPVYMPIGELNSVSPVLKLSWMIGMLAGRLEMIPLLAIFNSELFKDTS